MRVGIVGGGAAGLAAAYELAKALNQVALYERAPFLGGQASTFDVGGAPLERGYHHLFISDTDVVSLINELGLGHKLRWIESKVGIFYGGRIYDFVTPTDLLRFTPLSPVDRVRLGLVTMYLRYYKNWRKLESFTANEWIRKYAGRRAYEVVWGPLLRGKFGEDYYQKVGMPWFWGKIQTRFASRGKGLRGMQREKLGYPMGSFGEVFDVLAQRIRAMGNEVSLSTSVRRIVLEDGRAAGLEVERPDGTVATERFDAILATAPSYIFPKLVPTLPKEYVQGLNSVQYLAAVLLILVLKHPISHIYWLNIADRSIPFVGLIEHTNFIETEHYGGKHIAYLSNYLSTGHDLYKKSHEELLEEYLPHLCKINPNFDPSWIETSYHHRVDAAQPIIGPNYSKQIPDHRTPVKGLYLANTTQIYPEDRGTNYSVRMGKRVARLIIEDFG